MSERVTSKQLDMMRHAWGSGGRKPGYRTHYCTSLEDPDMKELVSMGLFMEPVGVGTVGEGHGIFHLTDKAIKDFLKVT